MIFGGIFPGSVVSILNCLAPGVKVRLSYVGVEIPTMLGVPFL